MIGHRSSVFTLLLLNTLASTLVLALVSVLALQRVADEHPRRDLARALFQTVVETLPPERLDGLEVGDLRFRVVPAEGPADPTLDALRQGVAEDPDGLPILFHDGGLLAARVHDGALVVLSGFGRDLSERALVLVGVVVLTVLLVLGINVLVIRRLTRPFSVFGTVAGSVDGGSPSQRVPLEGTLGEFRDLALAFNGMLDRLEHGAAVRRHMLLAIPHEVRTPLTRLRVRKDLVTDEALRQGITRDIEALEDLLNTILQTERIQSREGGVQRTPIPLDSFIRELLDPIQERHPAVALVLDTAVPVVQADAFGLSLVVRNLVSNALRHGLGRPITVTVTTQDDALVLSVADRGEGVPTDQVPYMTEPFWRLDESRQRKSGGYGLGLSLCDRVAAGHGGTLTITSAPGAGTTVTLTLPGAVPR
jgi:signal transduction histidine kinase